MDGEAADLFLDFEMQIWSLPKWNEAGNLGWGEKGYRSHQKSFAYHLVKDTPLQFLAFFEMLHKQKRLYFLNLHLIYWLPLNILSSTFTTSMNMEKLWIYGKTVDLNKERNHRFF